MKKILKYPKPPKQFLHQKLVEIQRTNPAKYKEIVDTECPEFYGLPSFHNNGKCTGEYKCRECWEEALKYE